MVRKVLVSVADLHANNAGPKARTDIEDVLEQDGYELWKLPFNYESKIKKLKYKYWVFPHKILNCNSPKRNYNPD